jgi:hypothetical protein
MELPTLGRNIGTFLVLTAVFAGKAVAYPTPVDSTGNTLRWPLSLETPEVYYEVEAPNAQLSEWYSFLVDDAARLWTNAEGSFLEITPTDGERTAQITVHFRTSLDDAPYSAGYSQFDQLNEDGTPAHCSIFVQASSSSSFLALGKTILHEFGHCIGLGHSLIPEAIMSYKLDRNGFALDLDDEAAVARLYPADGSDPELPPGCQVGRSRTRNNHIGELFWLLLLGQLSASILSIDRRARAAISSGTVTSKRIS